MSRNPRLSSADGELFLGGGAGVEDPLVSLLFSSSSAGNSLLGVERHPQLPEPGYDLTRSSCSCWPSRCLNAPKRKPRGTLSVAERSGLLLNGSEHPKGCPEDLEWCDDPAAEQWYGFSCLALTQTVEQCSSEKSCFVSYKLALKRAVCFV